jgi:hypothetical protein
MPKKRSSQKEADTCRKCASSLTDQPCYHDRKMQFARLLSATFQVWRDPARIPLRQSLQHTCVSMYLEHAVLTCADVTVILISLLMHGCLHGLASLEGGVHPKAPTTTSPILALACEFLCDIPFAPFTHHFLLMRPVSGLTLCLRWDVSTCKQSQNDCKAL